MSERVGAPRVAASSYLNTAPLVWSFARGPRRGEVDLLTDTAPARCADMLARGQVEAALVPVVEYQRLPETAVVPGVCVGARREVQSVVLVTRGAPLEEVRTVALDPAIELRGSVAAPLSGASTSHGPPRAAARAGSRLRLLR